MRSREQSTADVDYCAVVCRSAVQRASGEATHGENAKAEENCSSSGTFLLFPAALVFTVPAQTAMFSGNELLHRHANQSDRNGSRRYG